MAPRYGTAQVSTPSECEIAVVRAFAAPAALVWTAFTDPDLVSRWWGPSFAPIVSCEIDLRVGGTWRYVIARSDGQEIGFSGTYLEVETGRRLVFTEALDGQPGEVVNTLTLDEHDGVTTTTIVSVTPSREVRDAMLETGMERGVQDHYDQLEDLLAAASSTTAEQFRRLASDFSARVHAAPIDAWDNPCPCAGWVARDIVVHMVEWMPGFLASVGTDLGPIPSAVDDPVAAWDQLVIALQAVLDDPVASSREITHEHLGTQTVEQVIGSIMLGDIVIHTWDLARATGGDERLDPEMVHTMLGGFAAMGDTLAASGQFAAIVDVPAEADEQTRMLALAGRRA